MNRLVDKWEQMGMLNNLQEGDKITLATLLEESVERYNKILAIHNTFNIEVVGWVIPLVARLFREGKITEYCHINFELLEDEFKKSKETIRSYSSLHIEESYFTDAVVNSYKPLIK